MVRLCILSTLVPMRAKGNKFFTLPSAAESRRSQREREEEISNIIKINEHELFSEN